MIKRYFERFGRVENVAKHSPFVNFAFVTFDDAEAVDRVMQCGPHFVDHDSPALSQEVGRRG